jgi:imidazoleglycerol-phosphate dehydratase / histidinol-phosphatase
MQKQKYLFIDRDGTIIESPPSPLQIEKIEDVQFLPNVVEYLSKIATELDYKLVMVTNQNGLGTDLYPHQTFNEVQKYMLSILATHKIHFENIIIDDSLPEHNSNLRKPRIGRMQAYLNNEGIDIKNSFVIGDRLTDVQFAKNLGCKAIFIDPENTRGLAELTDSIEELKNNYVVLASTSWEDVYLFLKS